MAGLGLGVLFAGYWVAYYGITQVQGGNWGFLDLGLPSRAGGLMEVQSDGPHVKEAPGTGLNAHGNAPGKSKGKTAPQKGKGGTK